MSQAQHIGQAKDALASAHKLLCDEPDIDDHKGLLATTFHNLGLVHHRNGEYQRAVGFLESASRLEASQHKQSAVTLMNLANSLVAARELRRAKDACEAAIRVAQVNQTDAIPLALLQAAKVETELVFTKPRDSERAPLALVAMERFQAAAAAAPKPSQVADLIYQQTRSARKRLHPLLQLAAGPQQRPVAPTLPPVAKPRKPPPRGPYATREAASVRRSRSKSAPRGNDLPRIPVRPAQPATTATAKKPPPRQQAPLPPIHTRQLLPPVLWVCERLYGLQTLFAAAETRRHPMHGLRCIYQELRDAEPLMPRFQLLGSVQPPPRRALPNRSASAISVAARKAIELLQQRNEASVLRAYMRRWRYLLPQFRSQKPLRRAAVHLLRQTQKEHLRMRWLLWRSVVPPKRATVSACEVRVERSQVSSAPSVLEQVVNRWLSKITPLWIKVDEDRAKFDDATVADDVEALNRMKLDFASALATCFEKHGSQPVGDPRQLESQLEPFLELILNDATEDDATSALLTSLFINTAGMDMRQICERVDFARVCVEDELYKFLSCYCDAFNDSPAPGWAECFAHRPLPIAFVDLVFKWPQVFPIETRRSELAPHWHSFVKHIATSDDPTRLTMLDRVLTHSGIIVNIHEEDTDECDLINRAARDADVALVECLLNHGAAADSRMSSGMTPLFQAILSNSVPVVELLLDRGASSRALYDGMTPLQLARKLGQDAGILRLLQDCEEDASPAELAVRRSFVAPKALSDEGSADFSVEAFGDDEMGLSPGSGQNDENDAELDALSDAATDQVEVQLRNDALDALEDTAPPFTGLEIAPADAPRRRLSRTVDGELVVCDRISTDCSRCIIARDKASGLVTVSVSGSSLVARDCSGQESRDALRLEVFVLDNGNVAFAAADFDGKLLEPDLSAEQSRLSLVADEDATSFSEFTLVTVEKGEQDQLFVDAMRLARRTESNSAREKRRAEKQRDARLETVRKYFTDDFATLSFVLGPVDAEHLKLTYDALSEPSLLALDIQEPLAQHITLQVDHSTGFVEIALREAPQLKLTVTESDAVLFRAQGDSMWEVVELADGNFALESVERAHHLVEVRLDAQPHLLSLVHENDSSSFCELVVRESLPLSVPLMPTEQAPSSLTEDAAAAKIQALARRRAAEKRVQAIREEHAAATKIQAQQRRRVAAKRVEELREARALALGVDADADVSPNKMSADEAAIKIQAQQRRRAAKKRVEKLRVRAARTTAAASHPLLHAASSLQRQHRCLLACAQGSGDTRTSVDDTAGPSKVTADEAATKIQAQQRRRVATKRVQELREARSASVMAVDPPKMTADEAATKIQAEQRRRVAAKRVEELREARASAPAVDADAGVSPNKMNGDEAATKIQAQQRRRMAAKRVEELRVQSARTTVKAPHPLLEAVSSLQPQHCRLRACAHGSIAQQPSGGCVMRTPILRAAAAIGVRPLLLAVLDTCVYK